MAEKTKDQYIYEDFEDEIDELRRMQPGRTPKKHGLKSADNVSKAKSRLFGVEIEFIAPYAGVYEFKDVYYDLCTKYGLDSYGGYEIFTRDPSIKFEGEQYKKHKFIKSVGFTKGEQLPLFVDGDYDSEYEYGETTGSGNTGEFALIELVLPPLTLNKSSVKNIIGKFKILKEMNCFGNSTTGVHVHISQDNLDFFELCYIVQNINEEYVYRLWPGRKGNEYSKSVDANLKQSVADYIKQIRSPEQISTKFLANSLSDDRYQGVNILSLLKHGTVEFRYAATDISNTSNMLKWIYYINSLIDTAISAKSFKFSLAATEISRASDGSIQLNFRDGTFINSIVDVGALIAAGKRIDHVGDVSIGSYFARIDDLELAEIVERHSDNEARKIRFNDLAFLSRLLNSSKLAIKYGFDQNMLISDRFNSSKYSVALDSANQVEMFNSIVLKLNEIFNYNASNISTFISLIYNLIERGAIDRASKMVDMLVNGKIHLDSKVVKADNYINLLMPHRKMSLKLFVYINGESKSPLQLFNTLERILRVTAGTETKINYFNDLIEMMEISDDEMIKIARTIIDYGVEFNPCLVKLIDVMPDRIEIKRYLKEASRSSEPQKVVIEKIVTRAVVDLFFSDIDNVRSDFFWTFLPMGLGFLNDDESEMISKHAIKLLVKSDRFNSFLKLPPAHRKDVIEKWITRIDSDMILFKNNRYLKQIRSMFDGIDLSTFIQKSPVQHMIFKLFGSDDKRFEWVAMYAIIGACQAPEQHKDVNQSLLKFISENKDRVLNIVARELSSTKNEKHHFIISQALLYGTPNWKFYDIFEINNDVDSIKKLAKALYTSSPRALDHYPPHKIKFLLGSKSLTGFISLITEFLKVEIESGNVVEINKYKIIEVAKITKDPALVKYINDVAIDNPGVMLKGLSMIKLDSKEKRDAFINIIETKSFDHHTADEVVAIARKAAKLRVKKISDIHMKDIVAVIHGAEINNLNNREFVIEVWITENLCKILIKENGKKDVVIYVEIFNIKSTIGIGLLGRRANPIEIAIKPDYQISDILLQLKGSDIRKSVLIFANNETIYTDKDNYDKLSVTYRLSDAIINTIKESVNSDNKKVEKNVEISNGKQIMEALSERGFKSTGNIRKARSKLMGIEIEFVAPYASTYEFKAHFIQMCAENGVDPEIYKKIIVKMDGSVATMPGDRKNSLKNKARFKGGISKQRQLAFNESMAVWIGAEINLPPMKINKTSIRNLIMIMKVLAMMGCVTNETTGTHVHISFSGMNVFDYVFLIYNIDEKFVYATWPNRKGNEYAKMAFHARDELSRIFKAHNGKPMNMINMARLINDRRIGINGKSYQQHETIEFRYAAANIFDYGKTVKWIMYINQLINRSINSDHVDVDVDGENATIKRLDGNYVMMSDSGKTMTGVSSVNALYAGHKVSAADELLFDGERIDLERCYMAGSEDAAYESIATATFFNVVKRIETYRNVIQKINTLLPEYVDLVVYGKTVPDYSKIKSAWPFNILFSTNYKLADIIKISSVSNNDRYYNFLEKNNSIDVMFSLLFDKVLSDEIYTDTFVINVIHSMRWEVRKSIADRRDGNIPLLAEVILANKKTKKLFNARMFNLLFNHLKLGFMQNGFELICNALGSELVAKHCETDIIFNSDLSEINDMSGIVKVLKQKKYHRSIIDAIENRKDINDKHVLADVIASIAGDLITGNGNWFKTLNDSLSGRIRNNSNENRLKIYQHLKDVLNSSKFEEAIKEDKYINEFKHSNVVDVFINVLIASIEQDDRISTRRLYSLIEKTNTGVGEKIYNALESDIQEDVSIIMNSDLPETTKCIICILCIMVYGDNCKGVDFDLIDRIIITGPQYIYDQYRSSNQIKNIFTLEVFVNNVKNADKLFLYFNEIDDDFLNDFEDVIAWIERGTAKFFSNIKIMSEICNIDRIAVKFIDTLIRFHMVDDRMISSIMAATDSDKRMYILERIIDDANFNAFDSTAISKYKLINRILSKEDAGVIADVVNSIKKIETCFLSYDNIKKLKDYKPYTPDDGDFRFKDINQPVKFQIISYEDYIEAIGQDITVRLYNNGDAVLINKNGTMHDFRLRYDIVTNRESFRLSVVRKLMTLSFTLDDADFTKNVKAFYLMLDKFIDIFDFVADRTLNSKLKDYKATVTVTEDKVKVVGNNKKKPEKTNDVITNIEESTNGELILKLWKI